LFDNYDKKYWTFIYIMKVEQAEIEIVLEFNQQIFHSKGHPWY